MQLTKVQTLCLAVYLMVTGVSIFMIGMPAVIYTPWADTWQTYILVTVTTAWVVSTLFAGLCGGAWLFFKTLNIHFSPKAEE